MLGEHPPTFESFGLNESVYGEYEQEKTKLTELQNTYKVPAWIIYLISSVIVFFVFIASDASLWNATIFALILGAFSLALGDWVSNVVSGGKYRDVGDKIASLDTAFLTRVRPFEEAVKHYYESELKDFYETRLFRKHSGNQQFESAIMEFSSMLEELHEANKVFKTVKFYLAKYDEYVLNRTIGHYFQQKSAEPNFSELKRITASKKAVAVEKIIPAPERLYATPRIIDWDERNKAHRITGLRGEEIVLVIEKDYLISIHRENLAERVVHTSKDNGDGAGYDILSFASDGREKYIEVKSTTSVSETPFYLSSNELAFMQHHQEQSYIYRIAHIHEGANPTLKVYTAGEVLNANIIPTQFLVRMP